MLKKLSKNLIEYNILLVLSLITLVEKALLVVPTVQYFIIEVVLSSIILSLVVTLLYKNKDDGFKDKFLIYYNKILFYGFIVITNILLFASIYGTFFMPQAKNSGLMIFIWLLTLTSISSIITMFKFKLRSNNDNLKSVFSFLGILLLMVIIIIASFMRPNLQIIRLLALIVLSEVYLVINFSCFNNKEKRLL